jgi:hypothetical protein
MTVQARQLGTDFGYPSSQGEERPGAGIGGGLRSGACRIRVGASLYAAGAAAIRGFPAPWFARRARDKKFYGPPLKPNRAFLIFVSPPVRWHPGA